MAPLEYNYRNRADYEAAGMGWLLDNEQPVELHGHSCFLHDRDSVFHTYSRYARAAETGGGSYYFLDLTALGRQEDWEQPGGRSDAARAAAPDFST